MKASSNGRVDSRIVIAAIVIALVLATLGVAQYILTRGESKSTVIAPALDEEKPDQSVEVSQADREEKSGAFVGVPPKTGAGTVTLVKEDASVSVELGDDFIVQEGPDLFVGFGNNDILDHTTLFAELAAIEGKQLYQVPETIDASQYSQVFIYCKEFSTVFSVATLK